MSKPVAGNFLELPLEMQVQILEGIPSGEVASFCLVSKECQAIVQSHLKSLWNTLQKSVSEGPVSLKILMRRIEAEHPSDAHLQLFKRLADALARAGIQLRGLPSTRTDILELRAQAKQEEDKALLAVWPKILQWVPAQERPQHQITTADQIRRWMKDPINSWWLRGAVKLGVRVAPGITQLNILKSGLKFLPEEICRLPNLQELSLQDNQLTFLPDAIGELLNLKKLNLANNQLTFLPDAVGKLGHLQMLYLSNNQLTFLPDAVGGLTMLKELHLAVNKLTSLPVAIQKLRDLVMLFVKQNQIKVIPEAMRSLKQIRFVDFSDNQLAIIPDWIGEFQLLGTLFLSNNQLTGLPDASIDKLPSTTLFQASFKAFMAWDVGAGNTLGISYQETFLIKTIRFSYESGKWTCQVPYRVPFKFVSISADGETKSEKGPDRLIQNTSELQTAISHPPEF